MSTTPPHIRPSPSEERTAVVGDGVELCYQTVGDPADEPLLLLMGLGGSMTWWDDGLCSALAAAGFFVIRYDQRDTGRSTWVEGPRSPGIRTLLQAVVGLGEDPPYALGDLADDAVGLLDHLEVDAAHLLGVSMGGMVAQTLAIAAPDRVRTLTSVMSTTGRRTVGWQDPLVIPRLLKPPARTEEGYVERFADFAEVIGSRGYAVDRERLEDRARAIWRRGVNPRGALHHMLAVLSQPDRTDALATLDVPALAIHGLRDRMVHRSGGIATAEAIPGAAVLLLPGLGHDLPPGTFDILVRAVRGLADGTASRPGTGAGMPAAAVPG